MSARLWQSLSSAHVAGPVEEVADLGGEADGLAVVGATEGVALAEWGVEVIAVGVEVAAVCVEVAAGGVEVVVVGVEVVVVGVEVVAMGVDVVAGDVEVVVVGVEVEAVGVEVAAWGVEVGCVEAVSSSEFRLRSGTYTTIFASRPSTVLPPGTEVRI